MKIINDVLGWLISSGALSATFIFAWKYLRPLLEAEKSHTKATQEKELLNLIELLADTAVNSLAGNDALSGSDKFKAATGLVTSSLTGKGFSVDESVVNHAVQAAYEKSDLTPTIDPNSQPREGVVIGND